MDPGHDTGIAGDEDTDLNTPVFQGQVASNFPGALGNLTVLVEFNGLHNGAIDLAPGPNGRGFIGNFDVVTTTTPSAISPSGSRPESSCPRATT